MDKELYFGVDVSKKTHDLAYYDGETIDWKNAHIQVSNDDAGFKKIGSWVAKVGKDFDTFLFCMEYTGLYNQNFRLWLESKENIYSMVEPRKMQRRKKQEEQELLLMQEKSEAGYVELYQAGKKWGVKVDGKVIVPPLYHSIAQPVGAYCAFEQIPRHWGVMTVKGKVIVDAKYEKVEIRDGGIAVVTDITGKTQTIHLK